MSAWPIHGANMSHDAERVATDTEAVYCMSSNRHYWENHLSWTLCLVFQLSHDIHHCFVIIKINYSSMSPLSVLWGTQLWILKGFDHSPPSSADTSLTTITFFLSTYRSIYTLHCYEYLPMRIAGQFRLSSFPTDFLEIPYHHFDPTHRDVEELAFFYSRNDAGSFSMPWCGL